MSVRRPARWLLAAAAITAAAAGCSSPRPQVYLWGDSIGMESTGPAALALAGDTDFHPATYGGTAPCDWLPEMNTAYPTIAAQARVEPVAVVLVFGGNSLTSCMRGPDGNQFTGAALLTAYRNAVTVATAYFTGAGAKVYLVNGPLAGPLAHSPYGTTALSDVYRSVAAAYPRTTVVDAAAAVLDHGLYTPTLPCAPWETPAYGCVDGRIPVRSQDQVHFCPAPLTRPDGTIGPCPVYSSGATRFGWTWAGAITTSLRP